MYITVVSFDHYEREKFFTGGHMGDGDSGAVAINTNWIRVTQLCGYGSTQLKKGGKRLTD